MKEIEWLLQNRSAVAKEPWISVNDCQIPFEQTKKRAAASEEECRRSLISVCSRSGVGYGGGKARRLTKNTRIHTYKIWT